MAGARHPGGRDPAYALGMKVYDNDWFLRFRLDYDEAAALLEDWGVTFVLTQSRLLPMPDTAVKGEIAPEHAARYASYDDRRFREALARRGIRYVASCLMMFDPDALAADPDLWAIDAQGQPMRKQDWYVGIPPSRERHVVAKVAKIERAVRALEPDGVHVCFMRWPGFWEIWLPHNRKEDFPEFSYDAETLDRFMAATGLALPSRKPAEAAAWIAANAHAAWVDWKCGVVIDVIRRVREASRAIRPDLHIVLNTLPFGRADYDNAVESVYGQRFEALAEVVDVFEVMAYHQILKRPVDWPAAIGAEVKRRSGRTVVTTLQAAPLYLEGMHAGEGRSPSLSAAEMAEVSGCVAETDVDGQIFFLWTDFLRQVREEGDSSRVDVIRRLARARPA